MLQALRASSKNWVMKAVLGFIALSFVAFFGASNTNPFAGNVNSVIEVGAITYGANEVADAFNTDLQALSQRLGTRIDASDAIDFGLMDQTINRLVERAVFLNAARDLGITVGDEQVRNTIVRVPAFRNGADFEAARFQRYLSQTGQSEEQFVAQLRTDIALTELLGAVQAGGSAPYTLVDRIYRYRGEQRVAEILTVPADSIAGVPDPDEVVLAAYYEANKQRYRAPERRDVTLAIVTAEDLASEISISDAEIEAAYEEQSARFTTPERREIVQALFASRKDADAARARIQAGEGFAAVTEDVAGAPPDALGLLARTDLLPEMAEPAFALEPGAVSEPIESPLGWHLMTVTRIEPSSIRPLVEVRDELVESLRLARARATLFDVQNAFEDALAGGDDLVAAAGAAGARVVSVTGVSNAGVDESGAPVAALTDLEGAVALAFSTAQSQVSDVQAIDSGFYALTVDAITPSAVLPLEAVRGEVIDDWRQEERIRLARERAAAIRDRLAAGEAPSEVAADYGLTAEVTPPFDRFGRGANVPSGLIAPLFKANVGETKLADTGAGAAVGVLREVVAPQDDGEAVAGLRNALGQAIGQDLQAQLSAALRARYKVSVETDTIARLFR